MLLELKNPIKTETKSGLPAEITAINISSSDCFVGAVKSPDGEIEVRWNAGAIARNQHSDLNLRYPHSSTKLLLDVFRKADLSLAGLNLVD